MKKLLPFVFPLVAFLIVIFLAYRWYNLRSGQNAANQQQAEFGEGVQIEDLTQADTEQMLRGTQDFKKIDLQGGEGTAGEVRYELKDDKVRFSVMADLPILSEGKYQVWLKDVNSNAARKAFVLAEGKGGYTGSAAISSEALPFEVNISKELIDDNNQEEVMLKGTLQAE